MLPSMDNRSWVAYLLTVHSARNYPKALVCPLIHSRTADLDHGAHEDCSVYDCIVFCVHYGWLLAQYCALVVGESYSVWVLPCEGPRYQWQVEAVCDQCQCGVYGSCISLFVYRNRAVIFRTACGRWLHGGPERRLQQMALGIAGDSRHHTGLVHDVTSNGNVVRLGKLKGNRTNVANHDIY